MLFLFGLFSYLIKYCKGVFDVSSIVGQTTSGSTNGIGTTAQFYRPYGIVIAPNGYYYIADTYNHQIRKLDYTTLSVSFIAGGVGSTLSGTANGVGTNVGFSYPAGIVASTSFYLYIADTNNHAIRKVVITSQTVTTFAGIIGTLGSTNNAVGTSSKFNNPYGITLSSDTTYLLVADQGNNLIRKIVITTSTVTTLAGGNGGTSSGFADGIGTLATFSYPTGIAASSNGIFILVSDQITSLIRKIVLATLAVTTIAGGNGGTSTGYANGFGTSATFNSPYGIGISSDNSYALIADTSNNQIRQLVIATGEVTLIAGNPSPTTGSIDGSGTNAYFNNPSGICFSSSNSVILISDANNNKIRVMTIPSPTIAPTTPSISPTFSPSVSPTYTPSTNPSTKPTRSPTTMPSSKPTYAPTYKPSRSPSVEPSTKPSVEPSFKPSSKPTYSPSRKPTFAPSTSPTTKPSTSPTFKPSSAPSVQPTFKPSTGPSKPPTKKPTYSPSSKPTRFPSVPPTFFPSRSPTFKPSKKPTYAPSTKPTRVPSVPPTTKPSIQPTFSPSRNPTFSPTYKPSRFPSVSPSAKPTRNPTFHPTSKPIA